jgi:hypothetical protein
LIADRTRHTDTQRAQSVMGLFAIGNILLKYKRDRLPRDEKVSWISVLLGLGFMIAGAYLFAFVYLLNAYINTYLLRV